MVPPSSGDDTDAPHDVSAADDGARSTREEGDVDWNDLPAAVRTRLAELSADALGSMGQVDVPVSLRPVAGFAAAKRAKLGASALLAALRDSTVFRTAVVNWCREHRPDALRSDLAEVDAVTAAAAALLLESGAAPQLVELVGHRAERGRMRSERDSALARCDKLSAEAERLRAELERVRSTAEQANASENAEAERFRKRLREQGVRLKETKDELAAAQAELDRVRQESESANVEVIAQRDRERARAQEERARADRAEAEADIARQSAREARQGDEVRVSLLLDALEGAAGGLRRELGSGGDGPRPADTVTGVRGHSGSTGHVADVSALDRLLALPAVHLIVDGYNVTKTAYPDIPLADQRERLAHQLATLSARTGVEITVVFDGADVVGVPTAGPRGVRVHFSEPGVQADDVIRDLVTAEPRGRQLVVATSDREIVTSVRRSGAYAVASSVLVSRLSRV